jgi:pantoate--beta-alanine ligase
MRIVKDPKKLRTILSTYYKRNRTVGFVPTMGALHEGHLSPIRGSTRENDITVVSIFVNPLQFGPKEDYARYPRPVDRDTAFCRKAKVDFLFLPEAKRLYGPGYLTYVEVTELSSILCGVSRPGHFRGVTTVVAKLLNIVTPTAAYFGQKDFQQAVIIRKMAEDLDMNVKIKTCPTVREKDGLAMSSRNRYLSPAERVRSLGLYRSLVLARGLCAGGERDCGVIIQKMSGLIKSIINPGFDRIDHIAISDTEILSQIEQIRTKAVVSLAVFIGSTRLIDNMIVRLPRPS